MKRIFLFTLTFLLISGCSTLSFNNRYQDANWNKIIIAPFKGKMAHVAEREFEHALAISSQIEVIPSSLALLQLKEHKLEGLYKANPYEAMKKLAKLTKADGIILGEVDSHSPKRMRASDLASVSATIHAKLLDASNLHTVLSSYQSTSSLLNNENVLVEKVAKQSIEEFKEGLSYIK